MARPPVCKLMDYGKFKYENAQKAREARRNQTNVIIKEMKLRPKIDAHDYETKKGHVVRFLRAGDKVKITIMFRGREQHRPELGFRLLQRLAEDVTELGFVESAPKQDGRNMIMVLGPHRKKAEAKVELRRREADPDGRARRRRGRASARSVRPTTPATPWRRRRNAVARRTSTPRSKPDAPRADAAPSADRVRSARETARDSAMPKMKTHSGAKKRFKVTGTGKLRRDAGRHAHSSGAAFASAPTTGRPPEAQPEERDGRRRRGGPQGRQEARSAAEPSDPLRTQQGEPPWHASSGQ